jgi:hypothetical protein
MIRHPLVRASLSLAVLSCCPGAWAACSDNGDGINGGVLTVPFKYHFTDRGLTSGVTVGGYVGHQATCWDKAMTQFVVGTGLTQVSTAPPSTSSSSPSGSGSAATSASSSNALGLTFATGVISTIKGSQLQVGLLFGSDLVQKSSNYKYGPNIWASFSIGYTLTSASKN